MPGSTPRGYPYPLTTEPADGSPQIEALARAIDTDVAGVGVSSIPRFANAAARNGAIPSPVEGQHCWLLDIHQEQAYRPASGGNAAGWYPIGGVMPFGSAGLVASQSCPANTWTKLTLAGGTIQGVAGVAFDAANHAFTGPPGLYAMHSQFIASAPGASAMVSTAYGNATINAAEFGTTTMPAGISPWVTAEQFVAMPVSGFTLWVFPTYACSVSYKQFFIQYLGQV